MRTLRKRSAVGAIASLALVAAMAPGVASADAPFTYTVMTECINGGVVEAWAGFNATTRAGAAKVVAQAMQDFRSSCDEVTFTVRPTFPA